MKHGREGARHGGTTLADSSLEAPASKSRVRQAPQAIPHFAATDNY